MRSSLRLVDELARPLATTRNVQSQSHPLITTAVTSMLRRKNRLIRSGRLNTVAVIAKKIGDAIKVTNQQCRAMLCGYVSRNHDYVDLSTATRCLKQSNEQSAQQCSNHSCLAVRCDAAISDDVSYAAARVKSEQ